MNLIKDKIPVLGLDIVERRSSYDIDLNFIAIGYWSSNILSLDINIMDNAPFIAMYAFHLAIINKLLVC